MNAATSTIKFRYLITEYMSDEQSETTLIVARISTSWIRHNFMVHVEKSVYMTLIHQLVSPEPMARRQPRRTRLVHMFNRFQLTSRKSLGTAAIDISDVIVVVVVIGIVLLLV